MSGHWQKLGLLYRLPKKGLQGKLLSHTANPLPVHLEGDLYRVFFSSRDKSNRSSVGAVDLNLVTGEVIQEHERPIFEYGPPGSFYADGVSIGNCYEADGKRYILFMGWQNPEGGHWRGDVGRLILNDDLSLSLESETPILSADEEDPISLSYPWVMASENGGYDMWYGSTTTWDAGNGEMIHVIKGATSMDGHHWNRHGLSIPYEVGVAQAFSRPTVLRGKRGELDMWFSYRSGTGETYRIGHARREPGEDWKLDLEGTGITLSKEGWDSEMIEYPFVLEHKSERYMLYNGNGYGKTGFGLAIWNEKSS